VPQGTIVHVEGARPKNIIDIDVKWVSLMQMIINDGGKQIVGSPHGVKVSGKVKIYFAARFDLRSAASRGTSFDAENGSEGWFAKGYD
jgi:hypothetical protein